MGDVVESCQRHSDPVERLPNVHDVGEPRTGGQHEHAR